MSDPKGSAYKVDPAALKEIQHGKREDGKEGAHQPPYMFGTTQVEVLLKTGNEYKQELHRFEFPRVILIFDFRSCLLHYSFALEQEATRDIFLECLFRG
jgi:hypothetical protein